MVKKILFLMVLSSLALFLLNASLIANDESKDAVPMVTTCAGQELQLNGWGMRKKLFLKLYVASLYVQEKINDADIFLEMTQASCMRLKITSSKITAEKMVKATRKGFENSTQGNIEPIEKEVAIFLNWLKQPIQKGDLFEFAFLPHNKVVISKNDTVLGEIENKEFSISLFGIWLGNEPVQIDLKNNLLGS